MTMMQNLLPYLAQTVVEIGKEVVTGYIRKSVYSLDPMTTLQGGEAPTLIHGCPYCATAKLLASAYLYLRRAGSKPQFAPLYTALALDQVAEAGSILARSGELNRGSLELAKHVTDIELRLSAPHGLVSVNSLAAEVWDASELALDLAEVFNDATARVEDMAAGVDSQIKDADGVIEGKVREVNNADYR